MEGKEEQKDQGQEVGYPGYQGTTNDIAGTTTLTILRIARILAVPQC